MLPRDLMAHDATQLHKVVGSYVLRATLPGEFRNCRRTSHKTIGNQDIAKNVRFRFTICVLGGSYFL